MARNTEKMTAYLTEMERGALRSLADEYELSENGVMKLLIRYASGLPMPIEYRNRLDAMGRFDEILHR